MDDSVILREMHDFSLSLLDELELLGGWCEGDVVLVQHVLRDLGDVIRVIGVLRSIDGNSLLFVEVLSDVSVDLFNGIVGDDKLFFFIEGVGRALAEVPAECVGRLIVNVIVPTLLLGRGLLDAPFLVEPCDVHPSFLSDWLGLGTMLVSDGELPLILRVVVP